MKPLLPLGLVALLVLATAPLAVGGGGVAAADLGGIVDAGKFRAARVTLLEPGGLELGGVFGQPVQTDQPVLPIYAALRSASGWGAFAVFTYDSTSTSPSRPPST